MAENLNDLQGYVRILLTNSAKVVRSKTQECSGSDCFCCCRIRVAVENREFRQRVPDALDTQELTAPIRCSLENSDASFSDDEQFGASVAFSENHLSLIVSANCCVLCDQYEFGIGKISEKWNPAQGLQEHIELWARIPH